MRYFDFPSFSSPELLAAIPTFLEFTGGISAWRRRIDELSNYIDRNTFVATAFAHDYRLEWSIYYTIKDRNKRGKIKKTDDSNLVWARTFIFVISKLATGLPPAARDSLKGRFRDALKSSDGLHSLSSEITTALHLCTCGYEVAFHDLERGGGFDFLARKNGMEIEVECKSISSDKGNQIHKRDLVLISEEIKRKNIFQSLPEADRGFFSEIVFDSKVNRAPNFISNVAQDLEFALLSSNIVVRQDEYSINAKQFELSNSIFHYEKAYSFSSLKKFVYTDLQAECSGIISHIRLGGPAMVIAVRSAKKNKLIGAIHQEVKRSCRNQFTKGRPAVLFLNISEMSSHQLQMFINKPNHRTDGFASIAGRIFKNPDNSHIHKINFVPGPKIVTDPSGLHRSEVLVNRYTNKKGTYNNLSIEV